MNEYTIHDIDLKLDDDLTWLDWKQNYQGFLMCLVQEINALVVMGQFNSGDELDEYISGLVEDFEHVYTPSMAKKFLSLTYNAAEFIRELSRYDMVPEEQFFYQMAYFAQLADLKDELRSNNIYEWFNRVAEREALLKA